MSYTTGAVEVDVMYFVSNSSFLACLYVSLSFLGSNNGGGYVAFLTHCSILFPCFIASTLVLTPLCVTVATLSHSPCSSTTIICTFRFLFSCHFAINNGQSFVAWSIVYSKCILCKDLDSLTPNAQANYNYNI
jgi:hypothetical protein